MLLGGHDECVKLLCKYIQAYAVNLQGHNWVRSDDRDKTVAVEEDHILAACSEVQCGPWVAAGQAHSLLFFQ